ncbi:MAG: 16S rRNA (cytosine(967)-C(5))-methyltransferase RsmB [Dethiobacter sp.]|nr:16S rRNA (cytosine(967)-C(5))-methyltransferase RsmB [Dethiobacter sp.]
MTKRKLEAREASMLALTRVAEGAFINLALAEVLPSVPDQRDRRLAAEIAYGVTTYKSTLDWLIEQVAGRSVAKLDKPLPDILRIGFYQLFYLDRVPQAAAVHTTVELVKKSKKRALAPFVNGVLRGALRKKNSLTWPEREQDEVAFLSLRYAHPEWLVKRWLKRFGAQVAEALLAANNRPAPVSLRVNTLKITREGLLAALAGEGVAAAESGITSEGVLLQTGGQLTGLDAYRQGWCQIQGESAMLVSRALDPQPGERVLDACSAPGGKTTHLAQLMQNKGEIVALDIYPHRLALVENNCRRLGVAIVRTALRDARESPGTQIGQFDRILLDVPCSGFGVIRRKPDLKWRRQEAELAELATLQRTMLRATATVLRPDGSIIYSTCTNEPEETEDVVASFLAEHPAFRAEDIRPYLPEPWRESAGSAGVHLYPHLHGVDGFFICRLTMNKK